MSEQNERAEILLETGTNELEVMEFTIAGNIFGINVAKVKELMKFTPIKYMPNSHPAIEGIFQPRDEVITVVDLAAFMGLPPSENPEKDIFIITSFNKMSTAFHVHTVEAIHRVSWTDIEKPDPVIYGGQDDLATGIAKIKGKLITIIDFEKIVYDISPETGIQLSELSSLGDRQRSTKPIVIAEDSALLNRLILDALHESGYSNVMTFPNGQEAWDYLASVEKEVEESGIPLESKVCCIITDIEMPKMDGHRLTKLVKNSRILNRIPVIIFSSLIDETMRLKGDEVGASAQLTKPEIGNLVHTVDTWIL